MTVDLELQDEYLLRVSERYTSAELVELLDISIEDVIQAFLPRVLGSALLLEEVGMLPDDL